jgi:xanthine dehydrogenase iron-sulfur cluster and FAD-binding subunit A
MRASAGYRLDVAQSLLRKALIETAGKASRDTRLMGLRGEAA